MTMLRELFSARSLVKIGLLILVMSTLASAISQSVDETSYAMFFTAAVYSVVSAWILSFSKWGPAGAWYLILVSGILFVWIQVGHLWGNVEILLKDFAALPAGLADWAFNKIPLDMQPLRTSLIVLQTNSGALLQKVVLAAQERSFKDPSVRQLLWEIPVLVAAAWAAWTLNRTKNAIYALSPTIAILGYALYFSGIKLLPLQVVLAVLLVFMGMNEWERTLPNRPDTFSLKKAAADANMTIAIISIIVAMAAGWIPSLSLKKATDQIIKYRREAKNQEIANALGLEGDPNSTRRFVAPGLPRQHLIGGTPSTSQAIVFTVQTGELPPMPNNEFEETIPRYYWRGLSYDIYTGSGWASTISNTTDYSADELLFEPNVEGYRPIHLEVRKTADLGTQLYWSGTLISVSERYQVGWRSLPGSIQRTQDPLSGADALGAVAFAQNYEVNALLPAATVEEMRASPDIYPESIRRKYLTVPKSVPERVHTLAMNLTTNVNITNPYDKAQSIESYLRSYPYSLDVPPPPPGRDVADYFLFDLGRGYCDYYATAMVILAREAGLPARLVTGYSSGAYLPSSAQYVVREANAHSWPEIYFSGIGWVEFEPTASQPEITRPLERQEVSPPSIGPTQAVEGTKDENQSPTTAPVNNYLMGIVLIVIVIAATVVGGFLIQFRPLGKADIRDIYARVFHQGNKLAPAYTRHETPLMFAERLGERLGRMPQVKIISQLLAPAVNELEFLTHLYVRSMYSPRHSTSEEDEQARNIWKKLYWRLLLARVLRGKSP